LRGLCLCLCLRRRRAMSTEDRSSAPSRPDLPSLDQARLLSEWLAGPRSRALRRASIGRRERILEVGAGHCVVTPELQRRARGSVTCLDRDIATLLCSSAGDASRVAGDACQLPFRPASFDLVFFQNTLLWVPQCEPAIAQAAQVLALGGVLVAIEPDYGGMMEQPQMGLQELWLEGLTAAGADPLVGRKLPAACEAAGLKTWVELTHIPAQAEPEAVRLLDDLPLTETQRERADAITAQVSDTHGKWAVFIHVPYFLVVATKP